MFGCIVVIKKLVLIISTAKIIRMSVFTSIHQMKIVDVLCIT